MYTLGALCGAAIIGILLFKDSSNRVKDGRSVGPPPLWAVVGFAFGLVGAVIYGVTILVTGNRANNGRQAELDRIAQQGREVSERAWDKEYWDSKQL